MIPLSLRGVIIKCNFHVSVFFAAQLAKPLTESSCFTSRLCRGWEILSIIWSSLCNILLSNTNSRGSPAAPSTEPAFLIYLLDSDGSLTTVSQCLKYIAKQTVTHTMILTNTKTNTAPNTWRICFSLKTHDKWQMDLKPLTSYIRSPRFYSDHNLKCLCRVTTSSHIYDPEPCNMQRW